MKKTLIASILLAATASKAQFISDSVSMQAGYTHESYYSLKNGQVKTEDNTTWDLAFDLSGFGSSIRINQHTETEVYVYPNGNISDWSTADTAGISTWKKLNNSEYTWSKGALDQTTVPGNFADLGWGVYNTTTHAILGDSLHVLKLSNGNYKKLKIEQLFGGTYTFTHANLDGTNETTATLSKADFSNKRFAYYSIETNTILDREPELNTWDFVFTKYIAELSPTVYYGVTGVLINNGATVRKAEGVIPSSALWSDYIADTVINAIGYNWKTFNSSTFSFDIEPELSYFVQDLEGNLWHLIFTKFEGSSTGNINFSKKQLETVSLTTENSINKLSVYPNPAKYKAHLVYSLQEQATLAIYNSTGVLVHQETLVKLGLNNKTIDLANYKKGLYYIKISNSIANQQLKLIVQ